MRLPGGIVDGGVRRRDFALRPPTGAVELALAEAAAGAGGAAARVTALLTAGVERLGGAPATAESVRALAIGDRQFLARQLAAAHGRGGSWRTAGCRRCQAAFDVWLEPSALPPKEAGEGYPFAAARTPRGLRRLRVPTGADQEAVEAIVDPAAALLALAARCLADAAPGDDAVHEDELPAIDAALEEVAPEVPLAVAATCPDCGEANDVALDPYGGLAGGSADGLLAEVHVLASSYHWSEAEILALPRDRRRRYLALLDRAQGRVA